MSYRRNDGKTYIYFIRSAGSDLVKIGHSATPAVRLAELQTGSPEELRIEGVIVVHAGPTREAWIHRKFAHCRARGEWFRADADLIAYMAANMVSFDAAQASDHAAGGVPVRIVFEPGKDILEQVKAGLARFEEINGRPF